MRSKFAAGCCVLLGLLLLFCPSDRSISRAESAPDWLVTAGKVDLAHFGDGSAAVILGEWTDFTVDATGKFVMTERRAMRVLNRRSADRYLEAEGQENNSGKVTSIQTWAIAPTGKLTASGKKDIVTIAGFGSFEEFTDVRLKRISTPGAEDGSLVGSEVVTEGRIPISGEKFQMEEELPVRVRELHVSVPSGSLRWFLNHPERVEVVSQSEKDATFRAQNRSAVAAEEDAPPFTSVAAMVVINYDAKGPGALQSWEQAGLYYHTLFDTGEKPETEIASQVDTLAKTQSDTLSKIDALYTYVSRQIRYVAIEIGVGGYQPHPPADVYKNKYGDCKDKATLLISMLGKIGLRAYPALVGTRGDVEADPKVPTLATFDHMIVAFPVSAEIRAAVEKLPSYDSQNQILWLDPTSETDPLGQLPEMDQGVFALISYPNRGDLQRIPQAPPAENGFEYTATVHLTSDGTGTAEVEAKYLGVSNSHRHMFYRGRSQSEILKTFEGMVARYVNQSTFQKASISGVEDSHQQIVEKFSFAGNFSVASAGSSWFFQPQFLSGIAVPEVGMRPRRLPLDIGTPFHVKCNYREELPVGMKVENVPDKISVKTEFGELTIEYSVNGNVLTASENLSFSQGLILPEKYMEFRDFVNASIRAERQRLRVVTAMP
ncbi:MAG TPA: transglutaminase domain-containing protein [Candidatus Acidoferrales bacterium]|nr:transglutaminase domain-containing protein [Candidatus Acidoferrales bacterium]